MTAKKVVIDKSTTTEVDAATLERGWLAVSSVAGKEKLVAPALRKTVCVEQFDEGLRLISTDSYRLLVTWVPAAGWSEYEAVDYDAVPHATAIAIDEWGRARSLLAHLGQQAAQEENDGLRALVRLGVPWQPADALVSDLQLEGFDAQAVDLEYPDHERLQLPVFEGDFPQWRTALRGFKPVRTGSLALQQDNLAALAKAAGYFGEFTPLAFRFGGEDKAVAVAFGDIPKVHGLVMPVRWDFDKNAPAGTGET